MAERFYMNMEAIVTIIFVLWGFGMTIVGLCFACRERRQCNLKGEKNNERTE